MASSSEKGLFDDWPRWTKPIFVLAVMAAWIGVPMMVVSGALGDVSESDGAVNYQPMMAVLIAMTTATIAGVFVLMAFKIDRGARLEAKAEAEAGVRDVKREFQEYKEDTEAHFGRLEGNIAEATAGAGEKAVAEAKNKAAALEEQVDALRKRVDGLDGEASQATSDAVAAATSEEAIREEVNGQIREQVENWLTDEVLKQHLETVMMLDANGQVVSQFAKERAHELDEKAIARLIAGLRKVIKSQPAPVKKARRGWWASVKALFRRKRRQAGDDPSAE